MRFVSIRSVSMKAKRRDLVLAARFATLSPRDPPERGLAAAAIVDEESDKPPRTFYVDRVEDSPLFAPRAQQPGALELRQVRRQGRARNL